MSRRPTSVRRPVSPAIAAVVIAAAVILGLLAVWLGTRGPDSRTAAKTEGFLKAQEALHKQIQANPSLNRRGVGAAPNAGGRMPGAMRGTRQGGR